MRTIVFGSDLVAGRRVQVPAYSARNLPDEAAAAVLRRFPGHAFDLTLNYVSRLFGAPYHELHARIGSIVCPRCGPKDFKRPTMTACNLCNNTGRMVVA